MKKYLFLAILILTLTNCAEEVIVKFDSRLELTVIDEQNKPIERALVKFFTVIDGQTIEFQSETENTDSNGKLVFEEHFENLESRFHRENPLKYSEMERFYMSDHLFKVNVSKEGFQEWTGEIVLKDGDDISRTVTMEKK